MLLDSIFFEFSQTQSPKRISINISLIFKLENINSFSSKLVLIAVSNKLLIQVFAIVKFGHPYDEAFVSVLVGKQWKSQKNEK